MEIKDPYLFVQLILGFLLETVNGLLRHFDSVLTI